MTDTNTFLKPGPVLCHRFSNADGKEWIIPFRNTRTALELYQPSGVKGILLKRLLPYLQGMPNLKIRIGKTILSIDLKEELADAIRKAFNVEEFEFSIFGGTPSVHQKITIQIFAGKTILGYVKLTESTEIARLFNHEQSLLSELHDKGIDNIPHCLYNGQLSSGIYCFIQSTSKTPSSKSPHRLTYIHEKFLTDMCSKTATDILFDNTDFAKAIKDMKEHINYLPKEYREVVADNIDKVFAAYSGKNVRFSAYHADFTPWNMFVEGDRLFVFDWEYGRMTYPLMLDRYHFHVQQAIHVSHLSPTEIRRGLEKFNWFSNEDFQLYLLDILTRFTMRESGKASESLTTMLKIWAELLQK